MRPDDIFCLGTTGKAVVDYKKLVNFPDVSSWGALRYEKAMEVSFSPNPGLELRHLGPEQLHKKSKFPFPLIWKLT